jgi:hypothetical protein
MSEITAEQRQHMADLIRHFFDLDMAKADAWWKTPNPMLGGVSPVVVTMMGREAKLYQFVTTAIDESTTLTPSEKQP